MRLSSPAPGPAGTAGLPVRGQGVRLTFEREDETGQVFVHIWIADGSILGKARWLRAHIPRGSWVSIPPSMQPGGTWWLQRHVGFVLVTRRLVDGEVNDILWRPTTWAR
jgi:hypothetical protein